MDFLEQTQSLFMEIDDMNMIDVSGSFENYDLNGLLASISSENSYDWDLMYARDENSKELRQVYSSTSLNDPFSSQYKTYEEGMTSLEVDSSSFGDQFKGTIEAHLKPNSSMNNLIAKNLCFDEWSDEVSSFDLLEQQLASKIRAQEVADVCFAEENTFASSIFPVQDLVFNSLHSVNKGSFQDKLQNSLDNQYSSLSSVVTDANFPSSSNTLCELSKSLEPVDMSEEFLSQCFAPSLEDIIYRTKAHLDNTLSESIEFNPTCSDLVGSSSLSDIPVTCSAGHNSITTTINSDGKETSIVMHSSENDLLDSMKFDLGCDQAGEWWGNIVKPVGNVATDTGFSECISELNTGTLTGTRKRLFSELGIEELLRGEANYNPFYSSNFEYELSSNKRQMIEFSHMNRTPVHFANLARVEARANLVQPVSELDKSNSLLSKKDTFPKLQVGMLIDDSHSINVGRAVPVHPQRPMEPTKPTKKRARPGESSRPRPKDRQQIQDCIKELRGIIPNGAKCSIDSLLDRTIRYMLFLRSVMKYADKLQEPNEPKLIDEANGVVLKDSSMGDGKNYGVTWAFEVANQTMICPIIVEDMSPPGQMLIEMLCEEQGFFLEIVDIIRGFGLNILKGKMEIRKNKLWARFIVEANRHVTRIDVFWSLIHLLQQTNTSEIDSANKHCNVVDANTS